MTTRQARTLATVNIATIGALIVVCYAREGRRPWLAKVRRLCQQEACRRLGR